MNQRLMRGFLAAALCLGAASCVSSESSSDAGDTSPQVAEFRATPDGPSQGRQPARMCGAWPCATQRHAVTRDGHPLLELSIRIRSTDLPGGFERKYCSAALLDDQQTVLTSAHCLDDDIASYDAIDVVYRVAGETKWRLRATSFRLHRLWDIDDQSLWPTTDIALVALAYPVVIPQGAAIGYELRSAPFEIWGAQFDGPALTPTLYRCLPARGEYEIAPAGAGVSLTARCGLQPGASGGPFLQMLETGPVVVGVLSRYSDSGRNFSTSMDAFTDVEANFTPPQPLPG